MASAATPQNDDKPQAKDKGKRKAGESPDVDSPDAKEDPQTSETGRKLQYWFVLMMHDAVVLDQLLKIFDGTFEQKRDKDKSVFDHVELHMRQWEKCGPAAMKLLQWLSSLERIEERYTRFDLSLRNHSLFVDDSESQKHAHKSLKRHMDDYASRHQLLLNVARLCTNATTTSKSDQQSNRAGKSAKRVKTETDPIYQILGYDFLSAKTIDVDEKRLDVSINGTSLAHYIERVQLLLLARLISTCICNSEPAFPSSESTSEETERPSLDATFQSSDMGSSSFASAVDEAYEALQNSDWAPDSIFKPFEPAGGKTAAMDMIDEMRKETVTWKLQEGCGSMFYTCVVTMVNSFPELNTNTDVKTLPPVRYV